MIDTATVESEAREMGVWRESHGQEHKSVTFRIGWHVTNLLGPLGVVGVWRRVGPAAGACTPTIEISPTEALVLLRLIQAGTIEWGPCPACAERESGWDETWFGLDDQAEMERAEDYGWSHVMDGDNEHGDPGYWMHRPCSDCAKGGKPTGREHRELAQVWLDSRPQPRATGPGVIGARSDFKIMHAFHRPPSVAAITVEADLRQAKGDPIGELLALSLAGPTDATQARLEELLTPNAAS